MSAIGANIIISSNPQGKFLEGIVYGTPKPGTVMEIKTPYAQGNRHEWQVYQPGTDGNRRVIAVLLEDSLQGITATTAYVTGKMCRLYVPIAGEELNMLIADVSGTGDDHSALEMLIVDTGTGKLIATTGTPESEPFQLLQAITDPTADVLAPCMYTGY